METFRKTSLRSLDELAELGLESAVLLSLGSCTTKGLLGQISLRADLCHLEHLMETASWKQVLLKCLFNC